MDLKNLCKEIEKIAHDVAKYIKDESAVFNSDNIELKGLHDFVSYVDKSAEEQLIGKLSILIPEAGFQAEEGTSFKKGERYNWIIDPLDGTTNFLNKIHPHSISIALADKNEIVAGVVYEINGEETFIAWKDGGAWLNGKKIQVSGSKDLNSSLVATGFPYRDFSRLDPYLKCLEYFIRNSAGLRRMGCASIDLAYVACGRFGVFFEYSLKPWDIAAGLLLVREAGGSVSDFSGNEDNYSGNEILATNKNLFPEVLKILSNFMCDFNSKSN